MTATPLLYVDPQSPYAYLAETRATAVLGVEPEVRLVTLGVMFQRRGWGSWGVTDERAANVAEIERRAAAYGLPAPTWPADWPAPTLAPARAAVWAHEQGAVRPWLHAYWRLVFAEDRPAGDLDTLVAATAAAGLDGGAVAGAIAGPPVKDLLRTWSDAAWDAGVQGIPTVVVGDERFFGDDQLEAAAAALAAS